MTELVIEVGAATDVGRVRDHNEDAHLVSERIFAVADGMGGHAAGEVASAIAIEALARAAEVEPLGLDEIVAALGDGHDGILASAQEHPERRGMGTTITGAALVTEQDQLMWAVFNVGDSRVYRFVEDELTQVTVDHSEVQEYVNAGVLSREEAARHPARNVITQSLGMPADPEADLYVLPTDADLTLVICSDGLNDEVSDADIAGVLREHEDPQDAADALVAAALAAGGHDNVTVVVLRAGVESALHAGALGDKEVGLGEGAGAAR
ncbi:MAG: protein phosphatase 2C domain-containing protein [Actinomycetia bacterium]|nr:protein phosphatase 2C domain-containing protein [Actinomycetes bacterium]